MKKIFVIAMTMGFVVSGCEKLVDIDSPIIKYDAFKVYDHDESAIAVITGIYQEMSNDGIFQGGNSITTIAGLSSDELVDYAIFNDTRTAAYQNKLNATIDPFWNRLYALIYTANTVIHGVSESKTLTPSVQLQLLGEAKFLRAFFYYYLASFWGDVPLHLTSDYNLNSIARRSSQAQVYQQIIADLLESDSLLSAEYLLSDLKTITNQRIRPNKWVAKALLARLYLSVGDFTKAELVSSEIISQSQLFELSPINQVFLNDSKESIWQIQCISNEWNTYEAKSYVLTSAPNYFQPVSLSNTIVDAFEAGDQRKSEWVGSYENGNTVYYFANKYKSVLENAPKTEMLAVFRLSEQYLIRAEARAKQARIVDAVSDINIIRTRARANPSIPLPNPLPPLSNSIAEKDLWNAIIHEEQVEFFVEWGHRWISLNRNKVIDDVMKDITPLKEGGAWQSFKALFPIPEDELARNVNMSQNPGYK
jgi:starch-binding outer membrane protein, SusD/RagB family